MAALIREGMTGGQVAAIIESNFRDLEDKFVELEKSFADLKSELVDTLDKYEQLTGDRLNSAVFKADEEDVTTDLGVLKFKDREYDTDNFSGKGKIILRKNIVCDTNTNTTKNLLTQDMVSQENTVYEIRYDFDLDGETIVIPDGCFLDFQGGSFSNGTVTYNGMTVDASAFESNISYFSKELNKPIWWTGSEWVDATGANV